jgi:hypothetical protein
LPPPTFTYTIDLLEQPLVCPPPSLPKRIKNPCECPPRPVGLPSGTPTPPTVIDPGQPQLKIQVIEHVYIPADMWYTITPLIPLGRVRDWEGEVVATNEFIKSTVIYRIINGRLQIYSNEQLDDVTISLEVE